MTPRVRPHHFLFLAFACTTAAGCRSDQSANPAHCHYAEGDLTCADRYGDARPFCIGPTEECSETAPAYGCVEQLPPVECYSPCGGGAYAEEDDSCQSAAGDESEESAGADPICGDGIVEAEEECDDANEVDDDECSNTCNLPSCGDGIVQATLDEACDDGNTESGDTCGWNCTLPGTVVWSKIYEFKHCTDAALAVTSTGSVNIVYTCEDPQRGLMEVDDNGEVLWTDETPMVTSGNPSIAVSQSDANAFVIGGQLATKGQVRYHRATGIYDWVGTIPLDPSAVYDVAIDEAGSIVAAGETDGDPLLYHFAANGDVNWSYAYDNGASFSSVTTGPDGQIWALQSNSFRLHSYSATGDQLWVSEIFSGGTKADIAVDQAGNAFLLGNSSVSGEHNFRIQKFALDGTEQWFKAHPPSGVAAPGTAIAALPNGTTVVAGYTYNDSEEQVGLLSWHSTAGSNLHELTYSGEEQPTTLFDVAVSEQGFAVAIGHSGPNKQLYLLKVTL
ncbi:DUF4215 domain-containing protein [Enhygromyxa salina]|uniref:Uncharacterized protein n=1 Tax=Enhygromyxa salina TaxID=215803 RepID=A0A2S9Y479_9BACT|nr:DUF4215 domain-containing protein [Enhygromyxa salina]PRP99912.1 hypothetical protein ENSA7_61290 [Enhygromyxa salina]